MSFPAALPHAFFSKRRGWILLCALFVATSLAAQFWLARLFPGPLASWEGVVDTLPWLLALLVAFALGWTFAGLARQREREANELQRTLNEARLISLTRQMPPHFLFNTLNTIVSFVRKDGALAENLLLDLGELLRRTLEVGERPVVALHEELVLLDLYLDIQRVRFGSRLHVIKKIDAEALSARVPVLVLQPLVENALLHGPEPGNHPVNVIVAATLADDQLRLSVLDNGSGSPSSADGLGIGLTNTRSRLTAIFGDAAQCLPRALPGGGFITECIMPFQPVT